MIEIIQEYFHIFFISMLPIIELRGAVPVGIAQGLPYFSVYLVAVLGNMLPVPIILFIVKPILVYFSDWKYLGKIATFFLEKGQKAGKKFGNSKFWALFLFVAIPMPGTGAWTGSLAASILDLDKGKSFLAVLGGVLAAGLIMGVASYGILGAINIFA